MWKVELTTTINSTAQQIWNVLITPGLWVTVDPEHYKQVVYPHSELTEGVQGKMKTEKSPPFSFSVKVVDVVNHKVVTESNIPAGVLRISKQLVPTSSGVDFQETIEATGPFAGLFAKVFFNKQIKATLPAQHQAIKVYAEVSK